MQVGVLAGMLAGCTTLGPMPTTTGMSAVPAGRPAIEGQLGGVPAFHLSSSVAEPSGSSVGQAAVLFEPDRYLKVPGLVVGGRTFGTGNDTLIEPLIGYRRALDPDFAFALAAFGTSKRASDRGASYHGFRAGAEIAADGKLASLTRWMALHVQGALAVTRIVASGDYCIDPLTGRGKDCNVDDPTANTRRLGRIRGFYPSGTAQLAFDVGRSGTRVFHALRLALLFSAGSMPTAEYGKQGNSHTFFAGGLTATLTLGD